jgi:thymidylate synthase (FAD)
MHFLEEHVTKDYLTKEQEAEIERQRSQTATTRRANSEGIEKILYTAIPVLDHGFVRVIDYMGDDSAIVQAARVSYGRGTKQISQDRGLIQYLMRHRHSTPFEMCEIKFHVKLPIFVARQWIRHRTANVNEYSARYSILDREFYIPDMKFVKSRKLEKVSEQGQADLFASPVSAQPRDLATQSQINKQGRDEALPASEAEKILSIIERHGESAYSKYLRLLNENTAGEVQDESRHGIARELARMVLPANIYTQWYWKVDLHNLLHFLSLRADPHAQYEIRAYADKMLDVVRRWVPLTYEAFLQYRLGAATLSANALKALRLMLAGKTVTQEASGLSKREWTELQALLKE